MDGEENGDSLSAEASAYFESRGETTEAPQPDPAPQPDATAQEAIEGRQPNQGGLDPRGLAAVREEREERKRLKAELEEIKRTNAVLADRWNTFLAAGQQQEQPAAEVPPDPEQDIFAFSKWQAQQLQALQQQMRGKEEAERRVSEEQQFEAKVWEFWQASSLEYAQTQKDFGAAATWLAEMREKQLTALGRVDARFANKQARDAQIDTELKEIVIQAARQGISPAEMVYGLAKDYGYQAAASAAADPAGAVAALAANVEAETSLSAVGGAPAKAAASAEDIANMSPADFEKWLAKAGPDGFKRMASGRG